MEARIKEGREKLKKLFHLKLKVAASEMGTCPTSFKKYCRKMGIAKWPHRGIKKVDTEIEKWSIKYSSQEDPQKNMEIERYIQELIEERKQIIEKAIKESPSKKETPSIKPLPPKETPSIKPLPPKETPSIKPLPSEKKNTNTMQYNIHEGKEILKSLFSLPLKVAANRMGMCPTKFKKYCRKMNVFRWPHRKIKAVDTKIEEWNIKYSSQEEPQKKMEIEGYIQELIEEKKQIIEKAIKEIQPIKEHILLLNTNFDEKQKVRVLRIIDGLEIHIVHMSDVFTCTCKTSTDQCPHIEFITKKIFHQQKINSLCETIDFDQSQTAYSENNSPQDICSLCYENIMEKGDICCFPMHKSFSHLQCLRQSFNALKNTYGEGNAYINKFIKTVQYFPIKNKALMLEELFLHYEQLSNHIRKRDFSHVDNKEAPINHEQSTTVSRDQRSLPTTPHSTIDVIQNYDTCIYTPKHIDKKPRSSQNATFCLTKGLCNTSNIN